MFSLMWCTSHTYWHISTDLCIYIHIYHIHIHTHTYRHIITRPLYIHTHIPYPHRHTHMHNASDFFVKQRHHVGNALDRQILVQSTLRGQELLA